MIKPLISEKSMIQAGVGKYTFILDSNIVKPEIAKYISQTFKVDVIAVNKLAKKGKIKKYKGRNGKRKNQIIAIVTLKNKQKIDGFEVELPKAESKSVDKLSKENNANS